MDEDSFLTPLSSLVGVVVFFGLSFLVCLTGDSGTTSAALVAAAAAFAASLLAGLVFGGLSSVCG